MTNIKELLYKRLNKRFVKEAIKMSKKKDSEVFKPFKKLEYTELKVGLKVRASQLVDILDTYIILKDVKLVKNKLGIGTYEGIISAISKKPLRLTEKNSTLVYNDSFERGKYYEYEYKH